VAKRYRPGDIAVIYPETPPEDVNEILDRMGWSDEADEAIRVAVRPGGMLLFDFSICHSHFL